MSTQTRYHIVMLSLVLTLAGCEHRSVPAIEATEVETGDLPDQESWDARFFVTEEGHPRVAIQAAHMAQYEREDSTYMLLTGTGDDRTVTVYLFDARGDSSATLTADRVYYYDLEHRFEAEGNVVVVTGTGKRLETEHLSWLEEEKTIRTAGFVKIVTPKEVLQGYNLEADEDLENYRLQRVTGRGQVEGA